MLHTDIGMFRVTVAGLCPGEFVTFHCVLNVCSSEAFVAMSVIFQERHEFQSDKETLVSCLEHGAGRRHFKVLEYFGFLFFLKCVLFCLI